DVVHVYDHPSFGYFCSEHVIHHGLKCCWRIKHHQRFKKTPISPERGLPFVTIFNPDVIVSPANVHLRKILCLR
ncbi:hypothetical protein AMATHDRAFT_160497, partial [Amanita thiersii Skay4041]